MVYAPPPKLLASFATKPFAALRFDASHSFVTIQPGHSPRTFFCQRNAAFAKLATEKNLSFFFSR